MKKIAKFSRIREYKHELERLTQQLGEKHPRVKGLNEEIEGNRKFIQEVSISLERAKTVPPTAGDDMWILHGRVYSKGLKCVPNLTVRLYGHKGKWLEEFGYVCTDNTGYFKLSHRFVAKKSKESAESKSDTVSSGRSLEIFIRILDKTGVQVHIGRQPISPAPDKVEYREIILEDESDTCAPSESAN